MSGSLRRLVQLAQIPAVVSGTVAPADRRVLGDRNPYRSAIPDNRFVELDGASLNESPRAVALVRATDAGAHSNLIATFEGSLDGAGWYALHRGISDLEGALTVDVNGVTIPVAAALAGLVLPLPGTFPYYRIGLAGDGVAGGVGEVGLMLFRNL